MPIESSSTPPKKDNGITVDAQPGAAMSVKSRMAKAPIPIEKEKIETTIPRNEIARSGAIEKDVIPFNAKENILRRLYFVSPAQRGWRS